MKNKPECKVGDDGTKEWSLNGVPHREDGPAYIGADGTKYWYLNGKRHREDGPAVEWTDGTKQWWLNGEFYYHNGQTEYKQVQGLVKWLEAVERMKK